MYPVTSYHKKSEFRISSLTVLFLLLFLLGGMALPQSGYGQYFAFGKNRVQYQQFQWRYIQTEHFDIYYYGKKNYYLVDFSATTLEAAYKQLSNDFNHEIAERISVIIYDSHNDFSQTNVVSLPTDSEGIAGVTDLYKNRMTIPFMGEYASFRHTLHHELVHAVMNDMFYGGSIQSVVQNNVQLRIPMWFSEGISEYTSLGWDTNTDMYIRDAINNNYLPDISQLSGYFAYRGGQSVWNYIVEEYGREKIAEIFQLIKNTRSVEIAMKKALGLSTKELSKKWKEALKKRYYPEVANRENLSNIGDLLTDRERNRGGSYNTSPEISPQGDKIAMITNKRGFFDVVVINAITGEKIKTLIKGEDNVNFESLNILNPNLTWSPSGDRLALSTKSKGKDDVAIVDYKTGEVKKLEFPRLDAIGSVNWSPDGKKIAFDGNIGPYQDIFVYNMETEEFINVTNDIFSDQEPTWNSSSDALYFKSDRGEFLHLNRYKVGFNAFNNPDLYQTDIYRANLGDSKATRLTRTPLWSEYQPVTTADGNLYFVSDKNGIPNIYYMDAKNRTISPVTDLASGVRQISISSDGSRLAVNAYNEGSLDIFMVRQPQSRLKNEQLEPNHWAKRRERERMSQRVPATLYALQLAKQSTDEPIAGMEPTPPDSSHIIDAGSLLGKAALKVDTTSIFSGGNQPQNLLASDEADTMLSSLDNPAPDTAATETEEPEEAEDDEDIDYRNYVFGSGLEVDSTIQEYTETPFDPDGNKTDEGEYQPYDYRLKFSPDITYGGGQVSTYYGAMGYMQVRFSDLLGNHRISFASNLVFDLRNSDYFLQYGYLENQTNYFTNYFHTSRSYQTYNGELIRFRTYGGGLTVQRPFNKFKRIEYGASVIAISKDYSRLGVSNIDNETTTFLYPEVTFTSDNTLPGFLTPRSGSRYSLRLTGSPPVTRDVIQFASVLGDYRQYIGLGRRYSLAFRGSGAASLGRDSQTFFMGGMQNWINQKWARNEIPIDRLEDTFFTLPALPMRGHEFNTLYGDRFALFNAEFRFPLIAAAIPGPLPILPLYNIQGVAFTDIGAAWGKPIDIPLGDNQNYVVNGPDFDFKINDREKVLFNSDTYEEIEGEPDPGVDTFEKTVKRGDMLIGAGFGLRTVLLGLPFRYDVGWPYHRDGFGDPIHYITLGIDF